MRYKKFRRIIEILFILLLHSLFMQEQEEAVEVVVEVQAVAMPHQVKVVVEKMVPVPLILNLL